MKVTNYKIGCGNKNTCLKTLTIRKAKDWKQQAWTNYKVVEIKIYTSKWEQKESHKFKGNKFEQVAHEVGYLNGE